MALLIIITLFFIKNSILKPFNEIVHLPYELSKGHLKMEIKENKNRFFGKFLWGLDLLRESLETHKKREMQLEKEKKTLILSISHDIKTPLSTIKLYSKAIYDNLYESGESKAEAARQIEQKADQIESFVEAIIATSTENLLEIQVNMGEFYLKTLINQLCKTYADKLKLIRTEFYIDHFEDVLLKGDIERLIEVFENIIENAIKYGDGKYIRITFADEDYCKLITVTNSGRPIPGTEFVHMFESFWRGANSHDKNGSGLGLYICKEIMKKMDGNIFAANTDDSMNFTVVVKYS
jgi:signal transduction histidine kinase